MNGFYIKLLEHRLAANLMMFMVIMAGLWGMTQVRSQLFPDTELPLVRVTISWPNADAQAVRTGIAQPLDQAIALSNRFSFVRSNSLDGRLVVFARVDDGVTADEGLTSFEEAIDAMTLPDGAEVTRLEKIVLTEPVATLLIYGDVGLEELSEIGQQARQSLLTSGMAAVDLRGAPERERLIEVDLTILQSMELTVEELGERIKRQFAATPAGAVTVGANITQLVSDAPDWTVAALNDTVIAQTASGVIRLSQIATVREQFKERSRVYSYQGMPAVQLEIKRAAGEDSLDNAERLATWRTAFEADLPFGVQTHLFNEVWKVVQAQLNLVLTNGLGGMVLVILVLFLFLRTRIAIWVAAGIPVSFMGTLAFMGLFDLTINTISLFGFIIAIGIIVDDAIVVAEDAATLESQGETAAKAAQIAAHRMLPAVIASSLTTVAAFMPLLIIGGSFGNLLVDIPLVVSAAILTSLVECFLILPGHLGHHKGGKKPSRFRIAVEQGVNRFRDGPFTRLVHFAMRNGGALMALVVALFVLTLVTVLSGRIEFQPTPTIEQPTMTVALALLDGTSLAEADAALGELEAALMQVDAEVGGGLIHTVVRSYDRPYFPLTATLNISLSTDTDRPLTNGEVLNRLHARYQLSDRVRGFTSRRHFRGPGGGGDFGIRFEGEELATLKQAADATVAALQRNPLLTDVTDDLPYGDQQYVLTLTDEARTASVDLDRVSRQLSALVAGIKLNTIETGYGQIPVSLQLVTAQRENESWLQSLPIRLANGTTAPLGSLVNFTYQRGLDRISARNGKLAVTVTAAYNGDQLRDLYAQVERDVIKEIVARYGVQWSFEGQAEELQTFFDDTVKAIIVSVLLIFIILAWVFESWVWPFAVLLTVPFGLGGAVVGHWIMDMPLSTISVFGLIGLSGIVINDSIVLVTVFRRFRSQGLALYDAAVEASVSRLRPVVLTSVTTMAGLTPLLFETSLDAALLKPIAVGIVFGLGFATALILFMVPVLLVAFGRLTAYLSGDKALATP